MESVSVTQQGAAGNRAMPGSVPSETTSPYRCRTCRAAYPSCVAAEASWCHACDERICGTCVSECSCCAGKFCRDCLTMCDYGEGKELNCAECVKMLNESTAKCDSCNQPRIDLAEIDDGDKSVGYRDVLSYCGDCRALRAAREAFDMAPRKVVEISDAAINWPRWQDLLQDCPF